MSNDLPDGMNNVDRSAESKNYLMTLRCTGASGVVGANTNLHYSLTFADDGWKYVIESAWVYLDSISPFYSWIDFALDAAAPVRFDISEHVGEVAHRHEVGHLKSLSLRYPNEIRLCLFNNRAYALNYYMVLMYYAYYIG